MSKRVTENSKSGIIGALVSFLVQTFFYIKNETTGAPLDLFAAAYFVDWIETIWLNMGLTGGAAAWYRDKVSPRETVVTTPAQTQIATQPEVIPKPVKKNWRFSTRSKIQLEGVNQRLVDVVYRALELSPYDFAVTSGLRTKEQQAAFFKAGASKTMNSKHLRGRAVDIAAYDENGQITWEVPYYAAIADAFMDAADELGVDLEWGGDFDGFVDAVHFQLSDRDMDITLT